MRAGPFSVRRWGGLILAVLMVVTARGAERLPSVVIIVSDDQGWGDVGWNNPEMRTPHLDALARAGVRLNAHYVQPQCTPTRVALLTGRYPSRFGAHATAASNEPAFPRGTLTLAGLLRARGYDTGLFGKWHLGITPESGPNHHGFDYSYGALAGAVGVWDHRYRLSHAQARTWHRNLEFLEEEGHSTDLITDEAIRWVKGRPADRPFFLYLPHFAVHTPLAEKEARWLEMNAHIARTDRRAFAAYASHLDDAVGRVMTALRESGRAEDTLVVFFSDNGGIAGGYQGNVYPGPDPALEAGFSSNGPWRGGKGSTFEGGIRVPAFAYWPGRLKPGVLETPMHVVDWMPTLSRLLGARPEPDASWEGRDMWPWLVDPSRPAEERAFYFLWGNGKQVALREGRWKIRAGPKRGEAYRWELYDLEADPGEKRNLAGSDPERVQRMVARFEAERAKDQP